MAGIAARAFILASGFPRFPVNQFPHR